MKSYFRNCLLALLVFPCGLVNKVSAQTFRTLHSFTQTDGAFPSGGLLLLSNRLFGMTSWGGGYNYGTVFAVNSDGSDFTNIYNFYANQQATTSGSPSGGLISFGNAVYGSVEGIIFGLNTDGTGFRNIHEFSSITDGYYPNELLLIGNTLYGTAFGGGGSGDGTIFKVNTNGSGFVTLHDFNGIDGSNPSGRLVLSGGTLYGLTEVGGNANRGTIFKIDTDGSDFTNLYNFTALSFIPSTNSDTDTGSSNIDGVYPEGGLIISGDTLYGTASGGGFWGNGTVFAVNTNGTGFTNLHNFTFNPNYTNRDGVGPRGRLLLLGKTLYGAAGVGGPYDSGTIFEVNIDGTGFATVYSFSPISATNSNWDGALPIAALISSNRTLYGATAEGGSFGTGFGTVFSLSLPTPQLTITSADANSILTWPAVDSGFNLQSATNLSSPVWDTNLPAPVIVNGRYTVTNPISGAQQFFRLSQ